MQKRIKLFILIYLVSNDLSNVLIGMHSQNKNERIMNQPILFLLIENKQTNPLES